jgi:hypothetical protein
VTAGFEKISRINRFWGISLDKHSTGGQWMAAMWPYGHSETHGEPQGLECLNWMALGKQC